MTFLQCLVKFGLSFEERSKDLGTKKEQTEKKSHFSSRERSNYQAEKLNPSGYEQEDIAESFFHTDDDEVIQTRLRNEVEESAHHKKILYYTPSAKRYRCFQSELSGSLPEGQCAIASLSKLSYENIKFSWFVEHNAQGSLERLQSTYMNLFIMDLRWDPGMTDEEFDSNIRKAFDLIAQLDSSHDLEARYGFHRIVALVSGPNPEQVDDIIARLGYEGIGRILRQYELGEAEQGNAKFIERVQDVIIELLFSPPRRRRTALCLAGGGITGIYYEIGALKCIDDCLRANTAPLPVINNFDMYFGISAGAVISGILTAGYSLEELMAAIANIDVGRIPPISLELMRIQNFNYVDIFHRLKIATTATADVFWKTLTLQEKPALDTLWNKYSEVLGPPFHSGHLENIVSDILTARGATNNFRELPRGLYIGATDQDAKKHVLFGSEDFDHIPISKAIQASISIHPAFSSVKIRGRYYEDGAVTKTSNFAEAIKRGASLVLVLDPFLPFVSRKVGYAHGKGLLYNLDQDIRTLSFTRFANTRNWVLRKHPDVRSYTFVPSNRLRQLLSSNPMDHKPYLEIWRGAYLSTYRRINAIFHRMRGDFNAHGLLFDKEIADVVAQQLETTEELSFEDFFPERIVEIRQPPLSLQQKEILASKNTQQS